MHQYIITPDSGRSIPRDWSTSKKPSRHPLAPAESSFPQRALLRAAVQARRIVMGEIGPSESDTSDNMVTASDVF